MTSAPSAPSSNATAGRAAPTLAAALAGTLLLAILLVFTWPVGGSARAAVPAVVNQCNPPQFPTGAGQQATCDVTIQNTISALGATSSTVTVTACLAAAGVLPPFGCTTTTTNSGQLVTGVNQCNGIFAGGSNVNCTVEVFNTVPAGTTPSGVTVNQCIGSGQGGVSPTGDPTLCAPVSSTTNASVDQCNGSANGGGAPSRVTCTVTGGSAALPVGINQCNGSANGGGDTVRCMTTITNTFVTPAATTTTTSVAGAATTLAPSTTVAGAATTLAPSTTTIPITAAPLVTTTTPVPRGNTAVATTSSTSVTPGTLTSTPGLAFTGSNASGLVAAALMAMGLGGLGLLLSRRAAGG